MDTLYKTAWGDFSWDENKRSANLLKHNIDFYAAAQVFNDPDAILIYDTDHSRGKK